MEAYRLFAVTSPIVGFVEHLTNWYIRRTRRRFWAHRGEGDQTDKLAAFATLHEVLLTFSTVAAPMVPFVAEEIYQRLTRPDETGAVKSVHLLDFPDADVSLIDVDLESAMAAARTVVNLGHGLRKRNDLRVRQPLGLVTIVTRDPHIAAAIEAHRDLICDELNVHAFQVDADESDLVVLSAKADFKRLGPRLGKGTAAVAGGIAALDHASIAALLEGAEMTVNGTVITADDIAVSRTPHEGTVVATEGTITVALDANLTDDLLTEGVARELVNRIQMLRRSDGLDVTDRVALRWASTSERVNEAFDRFGGFIAGEVLAVTALRDEGLSAEPTDIDGHAVKLALEVV
jgi:isoleucyl-tRNA synthetase